MDNTDREGTSPIKLTEMLLFLLESTKLVISTTDLYELFRTFLRKLEKQVHLDRASIVYTEPDLQTGKVYTYSDENDSRAPRIIQLSRYPEMIKAIGDKKPVVINDIENSDLLGEFKGVIMRTGIEAIVVVPILFGDEVLAILTLARKIKMSFSRADIQLCSGLANLMAIAVKNASIMGGLETDLDRLKKSHGFKTSLLDYAAGELMGTAGTILSLTESLAGGERDESRKKRLREIELNISHLRYMVRRFSDACAVIDGEEEAEPERISLESEIGGVLDGVARVMKERGSRIDMTIADEAANIVSKKELLHSFINQIILTALGDSGPGSCIKLNADTVKINEIKHVRLTVESETTSGGYDGESRKEIPASGPCKPEAGMDIAGEFAARLSGRLSFDRSPGRTTMNLTIPADISHIAERFLY